MVQDKRQNGGSVVLQDYPFVFGHSPAELMFGRDLKSTLGKPLNRVVDYPQFEETARNSCKRASSEWDVKHRSGTLPELVEGQRVWVKAPSDVGREGIAVRKDYNPRSLVGPSGGQ